MNQLLNPQFPEASRPVPWGESLPGDVVQAVRAGPWGEGVDRGHGNPSSSFYFPSRRDSGPCVLCPGLWAQRKGRAKGGEGRHWSGDC